MRTILIAGLLLATACLAQASPKSKARVSPAKPGPVTVAHEQVKYVLKDPESAKFRSDFIGKDGAVCGFVNSKNSYGGYSGFQRYIATQDQVAIDSDEREAWKMDSRWHDFCSKDEPVAKQ